VSVLIDEARAALTSGHLAHLVTLNLDGSPQVNVRRDPRVVLSLVTGGRDPSGLDEYLVVHGTARITEGGAPELLQRLAEVYIGPGVKFPPMEEPPPGYVLHVTPTRVGGVGPWARLPGS
jgi:hypothetical protein